MNGLLSAGVFALAYVVGRSALGSWLAPSLRRSMLAQHALGLILGIALLTAPLVILAAVGQFRLSWLGAFGWIVAIATVPLLVSRSKDARARPRLDAADVIALAAATVFAVITSTGRDETLGAGRDQQIYAEAAVALAERGTASVIYAPLDNADRTLLRTISGIQVPDVTDGHAGVDRPIILRHPLGWPVWLALAHATFGIQSLYAAELRCLCAGWAVVLPVVAAHRASGDSSCRNHPVVRVAKLGVDCRNFSERALGDDATAGSAATRRLGFVSLLLADRRTPVSRGH